MKVNLRIPTSLNEITLGQYQEFAKLDGTLENTHDTAIQLKIVEIFCKVPEIVVRNMKATDIAEVCEIINTMFNTNHQLINKFSLGGVDYGFIPELDDMTFGEYMDLDTFISDNDNLHRAVNVLFRPIEHKRGARYTIKEYNPDTSENAKDFPLDVVLGAIVFFLQFRQGLIDGYAELFGREEREGFSTASNFTAKWGWFNALYGIAQGDITRFKNITELNVHQCLTYLEFTKEKNQIEAAQIKNKFK